VICGSRKRVAANPESDGDQKLVIADGHHRTRTALNYRKERPTHAGKIDPMHRPARAMMSFFNTRSEGLTILPGTACGARS